MSAKTIIYNDDVPDGEWREYKLATIRAGPRHYVWCGPLNNAGDFEGLWLDYFELRAAEAKE